VGRGVERVGPSVSKIARARKEKRPGTSGSRIRSWAVGKVGSAHEPPPENLGRIGGVKGYSAFGEDVRGVYVSEPPLVGRKGGVETRRRTLFATLTILYCLRVCHAPTVARPMSASPHRSVRKGLQPLRRSVHPGCSTGEHHGGCVPDRQGERGKRRWSVESAVWMAAWVFSGIPCRVRISVRVWIYAQHTGVENRLLIGMGNPPVVAQQGSGRHGGLPLQHHCSFATCCVLCGSTGCCSFCSSCHNNEMSHLGHTKPKGGSR
jgi:hypothetical protein